MAKIKGKGATGRDSNHHGLGEQQVAGRVIEHVLPGPHGSRVNAGPQDIPGRRQNNIGHNTETATSRTAVDIARPRWWRRQAQSKSMAERIGATISAQACEYCRGRDAEAGVIVERSTGAVRCRRHCH